MIGFEGVVVRSTANAPLCKDAPLEPSPEMEGENRP
jgi:hypothetical protein